MDFKLVCDCYTNMVYANGTFSFNNENNDGNSSYGTNVIFDLEYTTCKDSVSPFRITYVKYDADKDMYTCMYLHCIEHDIVQIGDKKQADLFVFCYENDKTFIKLVSDKLNNTDYYLCMTPDQNYLALRNVDGYDNNYIKCKFVPV
jgi:hypothetical protein